LIFIILNSKLKAQKSKPNSKLKTFLPHPPRRGRSEKGVAFVERTIDKLYGYAILIVVNAETSRYPERRILWNTM